MAENSKNVLHGTKLTGLWPKKTFLSRSSKKLQIWHGTTQHPSPQTSVRHPLSLQRKWGSWIYEILKMWSLSEFVGSVLGDAIPSMQRGSHLTSMTILPSTRLAALKFCILSPDLTWYRLTCKITQSQTPTSYKVLSCLVFDYFDPSGQQGKIAKDMKLEVK